jgi:hypothetical protein
LVLLANMFRPTLAVCEHKHNYKGHDTAYAWGAEGVHDIPSYHFVDDNGASLCLWTAAANRHIVHPSDDIWVWCSSGIMTG